MRTRLIVSISGLAALALVGLRWRSATAASPGGAAATAVTATTTRHTAEAGHAPSRGTEGHVAARLPIAALQSLPPQAQFVVPAPSQEVHLSETDQAEQDRVRELFADRINAAVYRCFGEKVQAHEGAITFRYQFARADDRWTIAPRGDALEIVDSSVPVSDDDAALSCMRGAVQGVTMPTEGSMFEGAEQYQVYWTWHLG